MKVQVWLTQQENDLVRDTITFAIQRIADVDLGANSRFASAQTRIVLEYLLDVFPDARGSS